MIVIFVDISFVIVFFRLLDDFKIVFGLKINCFKMEVMWIGFLRNCKVQFFGIKWFNELIKVLGIYYMYD